MNLSANFLLSEFTASSTAARRGINNELPRALIDQARATCAMLERIRERLGVPIIITSGYRCLELNKAIGSSATSDHILARAVDFKAPAFGEPFKVAKVLAEDFDRLGLGQLIHEYGQWIHASTRPPAKAVNRIITISKRGTEPGVVPA